jgi:MFS family permease
MDGLWKIQNRSKSGGTNCGGTRSKYHRDKLAVLEQVNFRRFYIGYSTSLLGTAMSTVATAFALLDTGGTPTDLGIVLTASIADMIAFLLGGGVLADRLGRRPVMLAADVARFVAQAALASAVALGYPRVWVFVAARFAVGVGNAFFQPALSGLPVHLVPRDSLGNANALLSAAGSATQVAGPVLAGVLIAAANPATVIAVDAATYAVSAIALALLRFPAMSARPERPPRATSLLADLSDGWAEFTARSWVWSTTLQFALFNLVTWGPYLVLGPVLARAYLGGARAWGVVMACYGGGAFAGGLLVLGRRPRRPLLVATVTTLGYPLPPLALALRLPVTAVAAAALLAGLGSALGGALSATVEQRKIPAGALSRVGAFNMVGAYAFGPIAFIAAGWAAAAFGARAVLGFGAAWSVLCTLAVLAFPAVRRLTWD